MTSVQLGAIPGIVMRVLVCEAAVFVVGWMALIGHEWDDGTVWPVGYNEQAFRNLRPGMTLQEVRGRFPTPLSTELITSRDPLAYRANPGGIVTQTWDFTAAGRTLGSDAYRVRAVTIDSDGIIVGKDEHYEGD